MRPKRARVYPQVEPGAAALVNAAIVPLPRDTTVAAALRLARKRDVPALTSHDDLVVLREDLVRGVDLRLGDIAAAELARPVPLVPARSSEVSVRRHLAAGAPLVIVRDGRSCLGAVVPFSVAPGEPPSMAARLARQLPPSAWRMLDAVGRLAAAQRARAYLVGGVVRDLLLERSLDGSDLDVVVEGDAPALAQRLAMDVAGTASVHERFLTASVAVPGGVTIDVITSRSERYDVPGALPRVMPAGIRQDLRRRDFTINAMAVDLDARSFGLLDPFGGRTDLGRRRISILHPLSFVEDPTRIFRAARYAARLGFALDAWTVRSQQLALSLAPYPALSGTRLVAEIEHIVTDADPHVALTRLGRAGVFRLFDPRYRFTALTGRRLAALGDALAWIGAREIEVAAVDLALVTLLSDQAPEVARAVLARLGLAGERAMSLTRALVTGAAVPRDLAAAATPSARARALRGCSGVELGWLWLVGAARTRAALDWFVRAARDLRPSLRGDEVIGLGVPRGPAVARVLDAIRDARLDGALDDPAGEAEFVRQWLETRKEG